ncbi:hypothetical protein SRHO_G00236560 [Serrasalmus rhombeus]
MRVAASVVAEAKTRVWEEFEEAELGDPNEGLSITRAEVVKVVGKLLGGRALGVDEIRTEFLRALNVVGLSWLTRLCNITWTSGVLPLEWQTRVVIPRFKKGDQRVCSNYRGSHFSAYLVRSMQGYWGRESDQ